MDRRCCFLVTGAGPLRLGQGLTCSAVLASVALLLSHRDYEPPCGASDDGYGTLLAAGTARRAGVVPSSHDGPD